MLFLDLLHSLDKRRMLSFEFFNSECSTAVIVSSSAELSLVLGRSTTLHVFLNLTINLATWQSWLIDFTGPCFLLNYSGTYLARPDPVKRMISMRSSNVNGILHFEYKLTKNKNNFTFNSKWKIECFIFNIERWLFYSITNCKQCRYLKLLFTTAD